ncbi:MAG: cupredoxin domain-containing protein [Actinomycetota bacterium]
MVAVATLVTACGGGAGPSGSSPTCPAASPEVTLNIVGQNIRFDRDQLEVPADTPFKVVFDNKDSGVPHNFALYRKGPPASDLVAKTEINEGTVVQELNVPGLPAGSYYYRCDVHSIQMTGTLKVT